MGNAAVALYIIESNKAREAVPASRLLFPPTDKSVGLHERDSMSLEDRISIDPAIRSGKPCIKGTRITVYDILEYLAGDMSEDEILEDFPALSREDIRAALEFAAARERRLAASSFL